jgi:hypothetical protein
MLIVDVFDPDLERLQPGTFGWAAGDRDAGDVSHNADGTRIRRSLVMRTNDAMKQQADVVWRFDELDAAGGVVRSAEEVLRMLWIYRNEMRYLLELCGFTVEAEYSDFHGSPPSYGREQIWVARAGGDAPG